MGITCDCMKVLSFYILSLWSQAGISHNSLSGECLYVSSVNSQWKIGGFEAASQHKRIDPKVRCVGEHVQQNTPTDYQRIFHFKPCLASLCIFQRSNQIYLYIFSPNEGIRLGRGVRSEGSQSACPLGRGSLFSYRI